MAERIDKPCSLKIPSFRTTVTNRVFKMGNIDPLVEPGDTIFDINNKMVEEIPARFGYGSEIIELYRRLTICVDDLILLRKNERKVYNMIMPALIKAFEVIGDYIGDSNHMQDYLWQEHAEYEEAIERGEDPEDYYNPEHDIAYVESTYNDGKSRYSMYERDMKNRSVTKADVVKQLKNAIRRNDKEVTLLLQYTLEICDIDFITPQSYAYPDDSPHAVYFFATVWSGGDYVDNHITDNLNSWGGGGVQHLEDVKDIADQRIVEKQRYGMSIMESIIGLIISEIIYRNVQ